MNEYLFAAIWGFLVGFILTLFGLHLNDWLWWVLAILFNIPNYFVYKKLFKNG